LEALNLPVDSFRTDDVITERLAHDEFDNQDWTIEAEHSRLHVPYRATVTREEIRYGT
jgi:hypothetical protein